MVNHEQGRKKSIKPLQDRGRGGNNANKEIQAERENRILPQNRQCMSFFRFVPSKRKKSARKKFSVRATMALATSFLLAGKFMSL